jgi:hypothetical protein
MKQLIKTLLHMQDEQDMSIETILSLKYVHEHHQKILFQEKQNKLLKSKKLRKKPKYKPIPTHVIRQEVVTEHMNNPKMKVFLKNKDPNKIIVETTREMLLLRQLENQKNNPDTQEMVASPTSRGRGVSPDRGDQDPIPRQQLSDFEENKGNLINSRDFHVSEVLLSEDNEVESLKTKNEAKTKPKIPPIHAKHNVKNSKLLEVYQQNRKKAQEKNKDKNERKIKPNSKLKFLVGSKYNNRAKLIGHRRTNSIKTGRSCNTTNTHKFGKSVSNSVSVKVANSMIIEHKNVPKKISRKRQNKSETPNRKSSGEGLRIPGSGGMRCRGKYEDLTKNFNQWFSEDYFENCLILDGEFGLDYFSPLDPKSTQSRTQSVVDVKRSFVKKQRVEEVTDTHQHVIIEDSHQEVLSSERLPLVLSNEYTVSNNRNQIGRELKEFLEARSRQIDEKPKTQQVGLKSVSGVNILADFDSIKLSLFLAKLRSILKLMKQKEDKATELNLRSKSCGKRILSKEKPDLEMRQIQSSRNINLNSQFDYEIKNFENTSKGKQSEPIFNVRCGQNRF